MAYEFDQFISDCRSILARDPGPKGREQVRARLEQWRPIERRARRGAGARLLFGVAVVGAVFFLPFVLDDFAARSKVLASVVVLVTWGAIRWTMRER